MNKPSKSIIVFFVLITGLSSLILLMATSPEVRSNDGYFPPNYDARPLYTRLGLLAQYTDVVGVGKIIDDEMPFNLPENCHFPFGIYNVRVENAFTGCTNGQMIRIYNKNGKYPKMPLANTNFVFIGVTNEIYSLAEDNWRFTYETIPRNSLFEERYIPDEYKPIYILLGADRSWWYEDDPNGQLPFQYFTNALQHLRFNRNWTNYYENCRDGMNSPSPRVKEDAHYDLSGLIWRGSTLEQLQMMDNDLLFPEILRKYLGEVIIKRTPK